MYSRRTRSRWRRPKIRIESRHSRRSVCTQRSACAFARGARTGVRDDADAFAAEDLVEAERVLAVTVADQKRWPCPLLLQPHHEIARLPGHPGAVRVGANAAELHAPRLQVDEKQDVEPLQRERLDREEIAG